MSSAQPPEPLDPNFRIELDAFEGPLDLLLHLVSKHELDILDLPVAFVTEKYLAYLSLLQDLNLDVAAEYLVMAAKLAHIKSKMLLPQAPADQDDDEDEEGDPREELIRRLLEYQKYKQAAAQLGSRGVAGRDVFLRGSPAPEASGPAPLAAPSLFKLLDAFQGVLKRVQSDTSFEIAAERISINERMSEIVDILQENGRAGFDELFEGIRTKYDIVVTFLAILEMGKMRMVRVFQSDPTTPIYLEYRRLQDEQNPDGDVPLTSELPEGALLTADELPGEGPTDPGGLPIPGEDPELAEDTIPPGAGAAPSVLQDLDDVDGLDDEHGLGGMPRDTAEHQLPDAEGHSQTLETSLDMEAVSVPQEPLDSMEHGLDDGWDEDEPEDEAAVEARRKRAEERRSRRSASDEFGDETTVTELDLDAVSVQTNGSVPTDGIDPHVTVDDDEP